MKRRNIPFSPPDMTEAEAKEVMDAILGGWITTGPRTGKLEKLVAGYVGVNDGTDIGTPDCVCLNSQTACAEMALRILGIGPGDEVIVPAYTYTASASVVAHVGAKIVFADVRNDSPEMDYGQVEEAVNERTKAVVPVDLAGIPCDYERLRNIVEKKRNIFIPKTDIQKKIGRVAICSDSAHSFGGWRMLGGRKVMCGALADFSAFSFHAVKNFTTAEGGALTWNLPFGEELFVPDPESYPESPFSAVSVNENWNQRIYRLCRLLSLHGQNKDALAKTQLCSWEYDILGPWYKCNMTDVAAAMGLVQFSRYPEMLARRKEMISRMDAAFAGMDVAVLKHYGADYASSGHLYMVRLPGRTRGQTDEVIRKMAERGISTNVHYRPLPMMTAYKRMGFDIDDFPNAFRMFENEITLPLNTKMTDEDVEYVMENFIDILK